MRFPSGFNFRLLLLLLALPLPATAGIVFWTAKPVDTRIFQRDIRYVADYFGRNPLLFQKQIVSLANPYYYFQKTHSLRQDEGLGFKWRSPILPSQARYRIESFPAEAPEYSAAKLQAWREGVEKDVEALRKLGLLEGGNLGQDLKRLAATFGGGLASEQASKEVRRLLRVLPLVYEIDGTSRFSKELGGFAVGTIVEEYARYEEFFLHGHDELWARPFRASGFRTIDVERKKVIEQYLKKEIASAMTPTKLSPATRAESITLQEMHPGLAPFRGGLGGDCALFSIPFYASHPNAKVFELRKNAAFDSVPDGYVFVTEVEHGGKRVPYVFTVNGPYLTAEESRQLLDTVAKIYGSTEILLPAAKSAEHLNNNPAIREVLKSLVGTETTVVAPKGWSDIASIHSTHSANDFSGQYGNYYSWSHLEEAKLVPVSELGATPTKFTKLRPYRTTGPGTGLEAFLRRPASERALIAILMLEPRQSKVINANKRMKFSEQDREAVRSAFRIEEKDLVEAESFLLRGTEEQIELIATSDAPIYGLDAVRKFMREDEQVKIARGVHDRAPGKMKDADWKAWFAKLDRYFEKEKGNAYLFRYPEMYLSALNQQQALIPAAFRAVRVDCPANLKKADAGAL